MGLSEAARVTTNRGDTTLKSDELEFFLFGVTVLLRRGGGRIGGTRPLSLSLSGTLLSCGFSSGVGWGGLAEGSRVTLAFSGVGVRSLGCEGGGLGFLSGIRSFGRTGSDALGWTGGPVEGEESGIRGGMEAGSETNVSGGEGSASLRASDRLQGVRVSIGSIHRCMGQIETATQYEIGSHAHTLGNDCTSYTFRLN